MQHTNNQLSETRLAVNASVQRCLELGGWQSYEGPNLRALTDWFLSNFNSKHVRFCSSGTVAIELALRALHLKPEDEVILSAYDYPGNFHSVEIVGAKPVLCQTSNQSHWSVSAEDLKDCVSSRTKAIIVSHLHGEIAPMAEIMELAKANGIFVIEDACQAIGAHLKGKPLGQWGDLGVFSFGGSKLVSAGRGGAIITNSDLFSQRLRRFCERGNDAFPLSEIQAAITLPQCQRLKHDHKARLESACDLSQKLSTIPWISPVKIDHTESQAFYKFGLCIDEEFLITSSRERVISQLVAHGISAGIGFLGFANKSRRRYTSPHDLKLTGDIANRTIVLHHNHLLHPESGFCSNDEIVDALRQLPHLREGTNH